MSTSGEHGSLAHPLIEGPQRSLNDKGGCKRQRTMLTSSDFSHSSYISTNEQQRHQGYMEQTEVEFEDVTEHLYPTSVVPTNTYFEYSHILPYFGMSTESELKTWLRSEVFAPIYADFLNSGPLSKALNPVNRSPIFTGHPSDILPGAQDVLTILYQGEKEGNWVFKQGKRSWGVLEYSAYCVYQLRRANIESPTGLYFRKGIPTKLIDELCWLGILRATLDKSKESKLAELKHLMSAMSMS